MVISKVITLSCPICRDDENGTNMVVIKCGHTFHSQCLKDWEHTQREDGRIIKCPYCGGQYSSPHYEYGYSPSLQNSSQIRLHSLSLQRALIIEEGEPSPEEVQQTLRTNLDLTKVLLNKETDRANQLILDLDKLHRHRRDLEATITDLKIASKKQASQISRILNELKVEKDNNQKALALRLREKEHLNKRINDGSSFIDTLKAESLKNKKTLDAIKADNARIKNLSDQRIQVVGRLHNHIARITDEKNALQVEINKMKIEKSLTFNRSNIHSNEDVLNDLNVGFQKLEIGYLALKELFSEKVAEASNAHSKRVPSIHNNSMNPYFLQPIQRLRSFDSKIRDVEIPDLINSVPNLPLKVQVGKGKPRNKKNKFKKIGKESDGNNLSENGDLISPPVKNQWKNKHLARNPGQIVILTEDKLVNHNLMSEQDSTIVAYKQPTESGSSQDKTDQVIIESQLDPIADNRPNDVSLFPNPQSPESSHESLSDTGLLPFFLL